MAAFVGKFVAKKILGERLENKFGQEVGITSPCLASHSYILTTTPRTRTLSPSRPLDSTAARRKKSRESARPSRRACPTTTQRS